MKSSIFLKILDDINEDTGFDSGKYIFCDIFPHLKEYQIENLWSKFSSTWDIIKFYKTLDSKNKKSFEDFVDNIIIGELRKEKLKRIILK